MFITFINLSIHQFINLSIFQLISSQGQIENEVVHEILRIIFEIEDDNDNAPQFEPSDLQGECRVAECFFILMMIITVKLWFHFFSIIDSNEFGYALRRCTPLGPNLCL